MRSISNRDYVIKIAAKQFLVQGYALTSMDDVVERSGVSKSNIYYHFKSKDDLALAVLDSNIAALQSLFREQLREEGGVLPRLQGYIEGLIQELTERDCVGGCPLLSMMVEAGKTNERLSERLRQFFQQQSRQLEVLFADGQKAGEIRGDLPAGVLASLVISWLEGSLMLSSIQKSAAMLRQESDVLLHILKTA